MKNTIKMSLVAALAVAGLSTTASAGGLEEAIKGVSISGKMEVEYDWEREKHSNGNQETKDAWDYDLDVTAKVPVNDQVTAVVTAEADHGTDVEKAVQTSDSKSSVDVTNLYFTYANGPVTTMVGKQGMAGAPWFDDEKANGVVGLYNAGPVTLAAGHFTGINSAALTDRDIAAAAVIGSVGPVNASLWYADVSGIADSFSINANAKFEMINVDITYTDVDYEEKVSKDADLLKAVVSAELDMFTPYIGYAQTGKDNKVSAKGADLTDDGDAAVNFGSEQIKIDDWDDADAWMIGATMKVDAWKFELSYLDGDFDDSGDKVDFDETLLDVEYKMSKNFTIDAFYSTAEIGEADMDKASIALEYKF